MKSGDTLTKDKITQDKNVLDMTREELVGEKIRLINSIKFHLGSVTMRSYERLHDIQRALERMSDLHRDLGLKPLKPL